jgi:hypothetical protein
VNERGRFETFILRLELRTAKVQKGGMEAWGGKNKNKRQMSISEE